VSGVVARGGPAGRPNYQVRRVLRRVASVALGVVLVIWTVLPVYNMMLIALDSDGDEYTGNIWPDDPSFESFQVIWTQGYWYLENFWHQFANSIYIGLATMLLTVSIGSLASFALGRMRLRRGWLLSHAALVTYLIPAAFLAIPFCRLMQRYGLMDNLWAVVAAEVAFATPYAILIFQQYGRLIPLELDDAARVDGASPWQVYLRIYLPLMAPALVAVGIYALLLAWNEYLYQFLLLSSTQNMTVPVAMDQFFDSDEAPWNYMMATAIVYSLPPIALYYAFGRYMAAGMGLGGVWGGRRR
jgi:multiple sugar transport system permease protein